VTAPSIATLGELRSSGHVHRSVKTEIRTNLIARLAAGEPSLPGIIGFDETVTPEIERALLAGHDLVLLGERGQGKTRLRDQRPPVRTGMFTVPRAGRRRR
jgi:magnesium chelatase subunit I